MTSKAELVAIEAILDAQGLTQAADFFDFDHVPDSVAHQSYRIGPGAVEYDMESCPGMTTYRRDLEVFVAWRPLAADDATTLRDTILPAEDALIAALRAEDTVQSLSAEYAEGLTDYIVLQLTVGLIYKQ